MSFQRMLVSLYLSTMAVFSQLLPVVPPMPFTGPKLEVELVELNRFGAGQTTIHRRPGKFLLLVTNRSPDLNAEFSLEEQGLQLPPLVQIGGPKAWFRSRQPGATVETSHAGIWLLKSTVTGKTLCTLTVAE